MFESLFSGVWCCWLCTVQVSGGLTFMQAGTRYRAIMNGYIDQSSCPRQASGTLGSSRSIPLLQNHVVAFHRSWLHQPSFGLAAGQQCFYSPLTYWG